MFKGKNVEKVKISKIEKPMMVEIGPVKHETEFDLSKEEPVKKQKTKTSSKDEKEISKANIKINESKELYKLIREMSRMDAVNYMRSIGIEEDLSLIETKRLRYIAAMYIKTTERSIILNPEVEYKKLRLFNLILDRLITYDITIALKDLNELPLELIKYIQELDVTYCENYTAQHILYYNTIKDIIYNYSNGISPDVIKLLVKAKFRNREDVINYIIVSQSESIAELEIIYSISELLNKEEFRSIIGKRRYQLRELKKILYSLEKRRDITSKIHMNTVCIDKRIKENLELEKELKSVEYYINSVK